MTLARAVATRVPGLRGLIARLDAARAESARLRQLVADLSRPPFADASGAPPAEQLGPDGLPIPPPEMRYWVTGGTGTEGYFTLGQRAAELVLAMIERHLGPNGVRTVLDFGCGSARVVRHLNAAAGLELHGSDSNRAAIAWCDEYLHFAEFGTNHLQPPTRYRTGMFDVIYAFSVFTHLTEPLQRAWMAELRRLLREGGLLLLSTHGDACIGQLAPAERARFARGEMVVINENVVGENLCGAFHPRSYVRDVLAAELELLELVPAGAVGNPPQDLCVLRRS